MRAPKFATLLTSALLFGTAGLARAQAYRPAASGHGSGHGKHDHVAWRVDHRDGADRWGWDGRWEDRRDRDDRRLPWYVKRDPDRGRRDYALERFRREHRALHERLERMHAQWHRAHDRGRRDRRWYSRHAELHARLRQQHARWHAAAGHRYERWDHLDIVRLPGIYFPGHYALVADLGGAVGAGILDRLSR